MRRYRKQALFSVLAVALIGLFVGVSLLNAAPADSDKYLKKSEKPWLGIYMQDINKDIAEALNIDVEKGVLVNDVIDDSPAQKAGLEDGDVIVRIGDNVIDNISDLSKAVKSMAPGDKADIVVYRDGKKMDLNAVIGAAKDRTDQTFALNKSKDRALKLYQDAIDMSLKPHGFLGVTLESLGEQLADYFQVKEGVLITSVEEDSPAEKAGLKAGDVILSVNGKKTSSPLDVSSIVRKQKEGDTVDLMISRRGQEMKIAAKVEEREMHDNLFGFYSNDDNEPNVMVLPDFDNMGWYHNFNPKDFQFKGSEEYKDELREQMDELRDQLDELKDQLNELKDELK